MKVVDMMKSFWKEEEGLTMVEYALVGSLVAIAAIAAFTTLGTNVNGAAQKIADSINT